MGLFKSKKDKSNERQVITSKKVYNLKQESFLLRGRRISVKGEKEI